VRCRELSISFRQKGEREKGVTEWQVPVRASAQAEPARRADKRGEEHGKVGWPLACPVPVRRAKTRSPRVSRRDDRWPFSSPRLLSSVASLLPLSLRGGWLSVRSSLLKNACLSMLAQKTVIHLFPSFRVTFVYLAYFCSPRSYSHLRGCIRHGRCSTASISSYRWEKKR